ncbi:MAG: hypothetical protein U0Z53_15160 [Blastocatellia bacterium]
MSNTNIEPSLPPYAEAVIISGPRKGEFINLTENDEELSSEMEKAFDILLADADRLIATTKGTSERMNSLLQSLRRVEEIK